MIGFKICLQRFHLIFIYNYVKKKNLVLYLVIGDLKLVTNWIVQFGFLLVEYLSVTQKMLRLFWSSLFELKIPIQINWIKIVVTFFENIWKERLLFIEEEISQSHVLYSIEVQSPCFSLITIHSLLNKKWNY